MSELRLADIVSIVGWLIALAGVSLTVILTIYFWPQIRLLWHGVSWRMTPALRSWAEANKARAVNTYRYDMSSEEDEEEWKNAPSAIAATIATTQQQPIAMGTTDSNALLLRAKAEALAAMVEAGVVGETKGLQLVFNVRPSSTNPRYLEAREALHAELDKRRGTPTPIAGRISKGQFSPR